MKNYNITMQAVVDMRMRFTDMCAVWLDNVKDARILVNSSLYRSAEAGKRFDKEES